MDMIVCLKQLCCYVKKSHRTEDNLPFSFFQIMTDVLQMKAKCLKHDYLICVFIPQQQYEKICFFFHICAFVLFYYDNICISYTVYLTKCHSYNWKEDIWYHDGIRYNLYWLFSVSLQPVYFLQSCKIKSAILNVPFKNVSNCFDRRNPLLIYISDKRKDLGCKISKLSQYKF